MNLRNDPFQGPYQIMGTTHLKGLSESWEWPITKSLSQAWPSFASMPWKLDQNALGNISYNNVKYIFFSVRCSPPTLRNKGKVFMNSGR